MKFVKRILLPMILLLLASIAFLTFVIARNEKIKTSSASTTQENKPLKLSNLTNINPNDYDSIIKNEYELANLRGKESNSGNELSAIDIEIAPDLMPSSVISRYVFSAPNDAANNWTMTFSEINTNFVRATIPKEDYIGNLTAINTNLWKFNFVTALQISEKNGGLKWRETNKLESVRITLRHVEPKNWLLWLVEYKSNGSSLLIKIDANSGRVVDDSDSLSSTSINQ